LEGSFTPRFGNLNRRVFVGDSRFWGGFGVDKKKQGLAGGARRAARVGEGEKQIPFRDDNQMDDNQINSVREDNQ
jgi:hypothetical protein